MSNKYEHALALYQKGNLSQALGLFDELASENPLHANYFYWLANTNRHLGNNLQAIQHATRAIAIDPSLAEHHTALALALQAAGQFDQSIEEFNLSLSIAPKVVTVVNSLGLTYRYAGKYVEANKYYLKALSLLAGEADEYAVANKNLLEQKEFKPIDIGHSGIELLAPAALNLAVCCDANGLIMPDSEDFESLKAKYKNQLWREIKDGANFNLMPLPNFLYFVPNYLARDRRYRTVIGNLCSSFDLIGDEDARARYLQEEALLEVFA